MKNKHPDFKPIGTTAYKQNLNLSIFSTAHALLEKYFSYNMKQFKNAYMMLRKRRGQMLNGLFFLCAVKFFKRSRELNK